MNEHVKNGRFRSSFSEFGRLRRQGFTYLELVFVIIIISTLVSMLLVRVLPAIDEAERAAVLKLEGQLRSSLTMEAARHVARGEFDRVRQLVGSNPINLMMDAPGNYLGEQEGGDLDGVPRGHWFFAVGSRRLIYRPREPRTPSLKGRQFEAPEFEVLLAFNDVDGNGKYGRADGQFYGVRLARVRGLDWLNRRNELKEF